VRYFALVVDYDGTLAKEGRVADRTIAATIRRRVKLCPLRKRFPSHLFELYGSVASIHFPSKEVYP
jgi:hypothetical protein